MITKIKRPISLLLVVMMIVGMFTILPMSASAAPADFSADTNVVFVTDSQGWDSIGVLRAYYWKVKTTYPAPSYTRVDETIEGDWVDTSYLYDNTLGQSVYAVQIPDDANWILFSNNNGTVKTSDTTNVKNGSWVYIDDSNDCQPCSGDVSKTCDQTNSLSAAFVENTGADRFFVLDGKYYFVDANGNISKYNNTSELMVAEVNGTQYANVNDAVKAAGEGGEVKLIADIKSYVGIDGDYTTTLDLNGHTITNTSGSGITLYTNYPGGKTFTIKDTSSEQTGAITINKKYAGDGCISDSSGRKVVIEGGTYTSDANALYVSSDNGWTINGGTFNGDIKVVSALDITGGTINGDINATGPSWTVDPAEVTISGGTVNGSLNSENDSTFEVSGGTFTDDVSEYTTVDTYQNADGEVVPKAANTIYDDGDFAKAASEGGNWYIVADVNAAGVTVTSNLKVWNTDKTHTITGNFTVADGKEFAVAGKKTTNIDGDITLAGQDSKVVSTRANKVILTQPYKTGQVYGVPAATKVIYDGKEIVFDSISLTNAASKGGEFYVVDDFTMNAAVSPSKNLSLVGLKADGSRPTITVASTSSTRTAFNLFNPTNGTDLSIENINFAATMTDEKVIGVVNTNTASSADKYSTITIKDSEISGFSVADGYGAVYLHGYSHATLTNVEMSGNGQYDVWGGAATDVTISGGSYASVYLNGGVATATVTDSAAITAITAAEGTTIAADDFTNVGVPAGCELKDNADGSKTVTVLNYALAFSDTPATISCGSSSNAFKVTGTKDGVALNKAGYTEVKDRWVPSIVPAGVAEVTKSTAYAGYLTYTVKANTVGNFTLTLTDSLGLIDPISVDCTVIHYASATLSGTATLGARMVEGGPYTFTALKFDYQTVDMNDYTFVSGDETVATIDGLNVTVLKEGTLPVIITSKSDPTATYTQNFKFASAPAKIGDTYYPRLLDAMKAAADGETIEIQKDFSESVSYTQYSDADKSVTIDLNGKTITGESGKEYTIRIDAGTWTITDSSDDQTGAVTYGKDFAFIVSHVATTCPSKLILEKGTFTGKTSVVQVGLPGGSGSNKKYYGGTLEVQGGTFITVPDTNETYDTNGNFKYTLNKLDYNAASYPGGEYSPSEIIVKGGTFDHFDPQNNAAEGTGTDFVDPDYKSVFEMTENGMYTVTEKTYVAQIGDDKYETLAEAFEAAQDDNTITLLADVNLTSAVFAKNKVTLDLNGKTITRTNGGIAITVNTTGDLTIKDSGENGKITSGTKQATVNIVGPGKLTLESGTIEHTGTALGNAAVKLTSTAQFTMTGGSLTGQKYGVYSQNTNEKVTISGGSVHGEAASIHTANATTENTITGGTFTTGENGKNFNGDNTGTAVSGGTFDKPVPEECCAEGYAPKDNGNGTYGVEIPEWAASFNESTYTYDWINSKKYARVTIKNNGVALDTKEEYTEQLALWDVAYDTPGVVTPGSVSAYAGYISISFTPKAGGTTKVTFSLKSDPTVKAEATITINDVVTGITLAKDALLENGANRIVGLKVNGAAVDPADYDFSTENTDIATIDGLNITPLQAGTVTIKIAKKGEATPFATRNVTFTSGDAVAKIGDVYYSSILGAFNNGAEGATVELIKDSTVTGQQTLSGGKSMTLDLNGYTLTGSNGNTIGVSDGVLTVKDSSSEGTGRIENSVNYPLAVYKGSATTETAKLIVESGTFQGMSTAVMVGKEFTAAKIFGGEAEILGGTFIGIKDTQDTLEENGNLKYVLNILDAAKDDSSIVVKGGTFKQFDPADNSAEGAHTNFVANGYKSVKETKDGVTWYTVQKLKLFDGHTITPNGDISVNFYINPEALPDGYSISDAASATVTFTYDNGEADETITVDLQGIEPDADGLLKTTCNVPVAYMAHDIHAVVTIDGEAMAETDYYSVEEYAETIIKNEGNRYSNELIDLMKEMLNYGAQAQTVFDRQMTVHPALANAKIIADYGYSTDNMNNVTKEDIAAATGEAPDMNAIANQLDLDYVTTSVVFLSESTLRHWFVKRNASDDPSAKFPEDGDGANTYGSQSGWYYFVQKTDIPAWDLDEMQTFTIGSVQFQYSALNYAYAVLDNGNSDNTDAQNLVKAMYLYNQAAKAYYATIG